MTGLNIDWGLCRWYNINKSTVQPVYPATLLNPMYCIPKNEQMFFTLRTLLWTECGHSIKESKSFHNSRFFFLPATFQNSLSRVKVRCLLQQCACVCVIFNQHHGNRCHKGDEIVAVIWLPSLCHFQPFISISNFFWFAFWWDCQETFQLQNTCTMWTP